MSSTVDIVVLWCNDATAFAGYMMMMMPRVIQWLCCGCVCVCND